MADERMFQAKKEGRNRVNRQFRAGPGGTLAVHSDNNDAVGDLFRLNPSENC
jgi:hypothetical protein